ncbi:MAG: hypothetical protein PQJ46_02110 [Spirochaetales bacterium]|nr:hypothetical protein [Spirochaetales bacterium]
MTAVKSILSNIITTFFSKEFEGCFDKEKQTVDFVFLFSNEHFLLNIPMVVASCYGVSIPEHLFENDTYQKVLRQKLQQLDDLQGEEGTPVSQIVDVFIHTLDWNVEVLNAPTPGAIFTPVRLQTTDELVKGLGYDDSSMVYYTDRNNTYFISPLGKPTSEELVSYFLRQNCDQHEYSDFYKLPKADAVVLAKQMIQFECKQKMKEVSLNPQRVRDDETTHRYAQQLFAFLGEDSDYFTNAERRTDPFRHPGHMRYNGEHIAGCDSLCFLAMNHSYLIFVEQFWNNYCES